MLGGCSPECRFISLAAIMLGNGVEGCEGESKTKFPGFMLRPGELASLSATLPGMPSEA